MAMLLPSGFAEEGHGTHVMVDILTFTALIRQGEGRNLRNRRSRQKGAR